MPRPCAPAELLYIRSTIKTLEYVLCDIETAQATAEVTDNSHLAFNRATAFVREGLIEILRRACEKFAPGPDVKLIEREISRLEGKIKALREKAA